MTDCSQPQPGHGGLLSTIFGVSFIPGTPFPYADFVTPRNTDILLCRPTL
ncbi:unnamed protein product [Ectocarpus sp. 12 AP-2014]